MRFIIDMNLSPRWVDAFRDGGFEATHWSSIGAQVFQAVRQMAVDLEVGALVTIEPGRARLRILPSR